MTDLRPVPGGRPPDDGGWYRYEPALYPGGQRENSPMGDSGWEILRKLWRRKFLIVGVTGAFALAGYVATQMMTPLYTAESRVLVGMQTPKVMDIQAVLEGMTANMETVRSEAYVMESRPIAERVANRLALDKSPEFNPRLATDEDGGFLDFNLALPFDLDDAKAWLLGESEEAATRAAPPPDPAAEQERLNDIIVNRLLGRVEVLPLNRSHVLSVTAQSEDPATAARIANSFGETYVEDQVVDKRQATSSANEWLDERIAELREQVDVSERAVEEYRREQGLYETKSDTVIAQELIELNRELVNAENRNSEAQSRLGRAEDAVGGGGSAVASLPAVLQSPLIQSLRAQQAQLQSEAAELTSTYTANHPRVRDIKAQVNEINGKISSEVSRIVEGLHHEASTAQSQYGRVRAQMNDLQERMGTANQQSVKLRQLEREAEANRSMLENMLQRSKETAGPQPLQGANAEVIARASVPTSPSFPPSNLMIMIAILIGAGCGGLLALLLENLDQTFRTGDDIEQYTGMPALALVPSTRFRRRPAGHVVDKPHSAYAGALRLLDARLSLGAYANRFPKVLMFTSALPREGKTNISASFAQLSAMKGMQTVVLDLDCRRPSLHRAFGQNGRPGLAELMAGEITPEQAVYRDPETGLHAIFAGDVRSIPLSQAWVDRLRLLLHTLSQHYDRVIIDASPVLVAPEVLHFARLVDKAVVVVKWGSTPKRTVASELKNLLQVDAPVAGVVLAQVDASRYNQYGYGDAEYLYSRNLAVQPG